MGASIRHFTVCTSLLLFVLASTPDITPEKQLGDYMQRINSPEFNPAELPMTAVWQQYPLLHSLLSKTFCTPASSAPVERVFSHSGLILRPHRAKMSDSLLETIVILKCNSA